MSSTATLSYQITPVPPLSLTALEAAVSAVPLSTSDMIPFGATLLSDTTSNDTVHVNRVVVFDISSAAFESNFPAAAGQQQSPFNNLFKHELGSALGMVVVAAPVVIA